MKNQKLLGIPLGLAVIAGLALGYLARWYQRPELGRKPLPIAGSEQSTQPASASIPMEDIHRDGEGLAQQYCSGCHLPPSPQLLTRSDWIHHIMPQMALWLGVEPINYESQKDGTLLAAAGIYPTAPMISEEDWFAIWDHYRREAPPEPLPPAEKPRMTGDLELFDVKKLNFHAGAPMISLVRVDPARKQIHVGDAYAGLLATLDSEGQLLHTQKVGGGPVGLVIDGTNLYVTVIGRFFPSDALEGAVVLVAEDGTGTKPVLQGLRRPTDTVVADLNGDGRNDLVVCSFGNLLGRFSWFEQISQGHYEEHVLLDRPGAIRSEVLDFDGDGRMDMIVQMAQAREGLYIFYNQGGGQFKPVPVIEQHPLFGYSSFQLVDFDRDGHLDILTANGDNGDNPSPHKNYHGVRLYLNDGHNAFREVWFYPMEGAYKALLADFDQDGDLDVAAISFYPDFGGEEEEGFVYLENRGDLRFVAWRLAEGRAGRWMTMDANDVDGDGDVDLVLGAFALGPTTIPIPVEVRRGWQDEGAAVLLLENRHR